MPDQENQAAKTGNQDTVEFGRIPAKFIDSTFQSLADGEFNGFSELTNYFDDFLAIGPGVDGAKNILGQEGREMSREDKYGVAPALEAELPNVPETKRTEVAIAINGLFGIGRLFFLQGEESLADRLAAKLAAGEPMPQGASGEDLLKWVNG